MTDTEELKELISNFIKENNDGHSLLRADTKATHDDVLEIKVVLKGYNGDEGLVKRVASNTQAINRLWVTIAVMAASSGGGYGIIRLIGG